MSFDNKSFEVDTKDKCQDFNDKETLVDNESYKGLFTSFCKHTSGHGFVRVVESHKRIQWIWIIIMILTFIGLIVHLILLLLRFYEYGVNSSFYVTSDNQLLRPDITVCPNQKYFFYNDRDYRAGPTSPYTIHITRGTIFNDLFNRYIEIWKNVYSDDTRIKLARYSLLRSAYNAKLLRGRYDILINLYSRNEKIRIQDLYFTPTIDSKVCVTYRPKIRFFNDNEVDETVMMLNVFMVGSDDMYEKLMKTRFEQQASVDGCTVYLHVQNTLPNLDNSGYVNGRGFFQELSFSESKIIRQNVNNKCKEYTKPISVRGYGLEETNTYDYSQFLCINTRRSWRVYEVCKCRSELFMCPSEIPQDTPFCHQIPSLFEVKVNNSFPTMTTLLLNTSMRVALESLKNRHLCHEAQLKLLENEPFKQECLPQCTEISYQFDTSSSKIDKQQMLFRNIYNESIFDILPYVIAENRSLHVLNASWNHLFKTDLKYSITIMKIIPKQLTVHVTEESLSYPIENLLSDIGGILGLYLGFSVMSMLEIIELWIHLFRRRCNGTKPKTVDIIT